MNFFWITYLLFYSVVILLQLIYFFIFGSQQCQFYHYMIALDERFLFFYTMNAAILILDIIALIPVYLVVFKVRFLSKSFWQGFFLLRIFMEIPARMYELTVFKSLLRLNPKYAYLTALVFFLLHIPSYIAMYRYIFSAYDPEMPEEKPA